jgi:2-succinyl-6-hydroxy-2,4-cyclohexadiene-1-carboxylate synthase
MRKTVLHYEEAGQPGAPVIVFLHGFMGEARSFRVLMESLADSFHCIAFDLPGHGASLFGGSEPLRNLCSMEDTVGVLLRDLDTLEISRFELYGYSMGGRIAQHIALAAPGRINRLILESSSFGIADLRDRALRLHQDQGLMAKIKTGEDFRAFLANWYQMPLFRTLAGTPHLHSLIEEKIKHLVTEYHRALRLLSVGGHSYLAEKLSGLRLPIFYFCGEQDEAYTQTALQIKALLPEMIVKIFKDASHNIHIQHPREISRAIRKILI